MARATMLRALAAYARLAGADEVDGEIESTGRAMRQVVVCCSRARDVVEMSRPGAPRVERDRQGEGRRDVRVTYPLRIDRDALTCLWGRLQFRVTNLRKTQGGFAFTATPELFSASEIEVYPDERILLCDGVPHTITAYRVEGHVVIAEATVDRPDDPELVQLMARRVALARTG